MGRKSHSQSLYCSMNGYLVGVLSITKGQMSFQYDKQWLDIEGSRPLSLSLPLQSTAIKSDKVYAYFENLLPDAEAIRQQMVDRLGAKSKSPFDLLVKVGRDCIGALTLTDSLPAGGLPPVSITPLTEQQIAQTIRDTRLDKMMGMKADEDFRISLAGAQEKTALTFWNGQWCKPNGPTPTTHIIKPPILNHESMGIDLSNSVDNEWFCLAFIRHLGMPVANATISTFGDQRVLVVERFDRRIDEQHIMRLPQEDMCQALGMTSGSKYEDHGGPSARQIMSLLEYSSNSYQDRLTFYKAQIVYWMLAGIDGHAKNFSISLQQDGYRLTPLYDVLSAYPYFGQGNIQARKIKMAMKVHSKNSHYRWHDIQARHWLTHAKHLGLSAAIANEVIEDICTHTDGAMQNALNQAPQGFDHNMGKSIADSAKGCLMKLEKFLHQQLDK